jgi:PhnB protein
MIMASDGMCSGQPEFKGVTLSITTQTEDEARKLYDALSDGGQQTMPMQRTFYSPAFGMLKDRFGVSWMVLQWTDGQS